VKSWGGHYSHPEAVVLHSRKRRVTTSFLKVYDFGLTDTTASGGHRGAARQQGLASQKLRTHGERWVRFSVSGVEESCRGF